MWRSALRFSAAGIALCAAPAMAAAPAPTTVVEAAEATGFLSAIDPTLFVTIGSVFFALAAGAWALRVSMASRSATVDWSRSLGQLEAKFEKSESILASHPGLVIVWDDAYDEIDRGWGKPRVLGGPAALASLLTFASDDPTAFLNPADSLLDALGSLPMDDDQTTGRVPTLKEKVRDLRSHGIAFSGSVVTDEGRSIECDGRVAGDQVTLWLTDPAVRLADETGVLGQARDKAADLHGALNQLNSAPLAAWRRGPDLKLEWVNRAYVEMVEAINMAEVVEEQIEIDPAFRELAEKAKRETVRTGRRALDGVVKVNVKGQRRVLRVIETPLHGAGEASFGGVAVDITRQEKAQTDLERNQAAHRKTLDQLSEAVAVFNGAQQLAYYNQAFVDLWQIDDADLRDRPSHGELLDRLRHANKLPAQADFSAWKGKQLRLYTEEYGDAASSVEGETPDETWNLPEGKTLRVRQQRHALGGVSVLFDNITETLELQSRYQTQIGVQRATLNNLAEAVAVFGADGRLALFNQSFESTWGLTREQLSGQPHVSQLQDIMATKASKAEEQLSEIRGRIVSFAPEDRVPHLGEEIVLRDGHILVCSTSPLPDGATLVTFLDITDSRERQKELEVRNQILEEADRIKSRFVDHISYQLRNPLNTIIGFTEMLESEMVGSLNERQKDYASTILTASTHLLDLINDIIDLAAIDAGRLGLDMGETDVRELIESAATFASLKAEDSQIILKVDCPDDIGTIHADERRLKQVLFNLLANGFAFTEAGGHVTVGAKREGNAVSIWVEDTGRGVSPEDQATIFDRFESSGPGAGAGLGLALVNSYVELHGGFVRLSSQEGEGTRVTCHLPVAGPLERFRQLEEAAASLSFDDDAEEHMQTAARKVAAE
ncbi:sensor histidine kinase [Parvularcula sp. LCG005]|uniref:sensor histidine kinase n=1 Tax=Parvularcula sp. LCG005 TaxID=3078805 RepID=UPI0029436190|nr:ATP-binding protein [Parvularcula sp. LCG005]WOI53571.1 PAS-domain containing protein [Parvularcula sp. LCG005]